MRLIGLTGGIGSGKSTVAGFLRELGAWVVDADLGSRAVVEPGTPGLAAVVAEFGPEILDGDRLARSRLAELVFNDPEALAKLNAITHPLVREWAAAQVDAGAAAGHQIVVQDIPLLFENGLEPLFEATILVWVPAPMQLARLVEGRAYSEADARSRIARQLPIDEKRGRATYVIDNSGDRAATRDQTAKAWAEITAANSIGP